MVKEQVIHNSAFLCGYFSIEKNLPDLTSTGWEKRVYTAEEKADLNNYYFPEFAQCMADDVAMYTRTIDRPCSITMQEETIPFHINRLMVWEAPFHIIVYAISVCFENRTFNAVTKALNALRNCAYYSDIHQAFIQTALRPIVDVYVATKRAGIPDEANSAFDYDCLVESGNKFKVFQIVQVPGGIESGDEDLLLYDAGTLARHEPLSTGINSPEYIQHILDGHKISVFSGWRGLALLDTFTLVTTDTPDYVLRNWEKDYFEKIYIYQLFRKVFLYSVNLHYRRRLEDVVTLEERLDQFEQRYSYSAISYNFLPNIISGAMEKSLATQRDYDQLNRMISKEIEARRNQAEEKTNKFLTFLTCLTIFSAIYDLASLLNESFGYDTIFPSGFIGFRLVGTALLVLVLVVYLILAKKHK